MEGAAARDAGVISSYVGELKQLRNNDGETIQFLSSIASENRHLATSFVAVIEEHIKRVEPGSKLWGLYLADSIVKNCKDFKAPFSKNLVEVFLRVYDQVSRELKQKMQKLLTVWKDQERFERRLVDEIAAQARKRDGDGGGDGDGTRAGGVPQSSSGLLPPNRSAPNHVENRSYARNQQATAGHPPQQPPLLPSGAGGYQQAYNTGPMHQAQGQGQRQGPVSSVSSFPFQASMRPAGSAAAGQPPLDMKTSNLMSQLQKSGLLQTLVNNMNSTSKNNTSTTTTTNINTNPNVQRPIHPSFNQNHKPRNSHLSQSALPEQHQKGFDRIAENSLLSQESESKSDTEDDADNKKAALERKKKKKEEEEELTKKEVPVEYTRAYLRTRHEGVINSFYFDQTHQCMQTGKRFREKSRLQRHLDLVYQRKKLMREDTMSRKWLVKLEQWKNSISSACINGENEDKDERKDAKTKAPTIDDMLVSDPSKLELSISADPKATRCPLSGEKFKVFYSDKYDSWRYQDAVKLVKSYQQLPKGTIVSISALPAEQRPDLVDMAMIPNSSMYAPGPSAKRQKLN